MSDTTLSKEEKQYKRLTEEPVARLVLELGLPTTISMVERGDRYCGSERIVQIAWKYGDHPSLCENLCFLYSGVGTGNGIQLCDEQCAPV